MSQPLDQVYQNPVMTRQPTNNPPRSANGSFGPVFIVLAVIVVVSAVACVLGRVCSKRHHRSKEGSHKPKKASGKQSQGLGPKEWESRQKPINFNMRDGGDIEFGFDKKSSKGPKTNGGGGGGGGGGNPKPTHYNSNNNYNNHNNGGYRPDQVRFADNV